jgi:hypothetical protein
MANKNDLFDFDETSAANNDNVQGANIAENCAPSGINNAIRGLASIVKRAVGSQGAAIPSAATTAIGAAGTALYTTITGSTAITSFGTVGAGTLRVVEFTGSLTLTHNATSLKLPGGASIVTQAGDVAFMVSLGAGNWKCLSYIRAAGLPGQELLAVQIASNSAAIDFVLTSWLAQFRAFKVVITDMVPVTDNTDLFMRFSTNTGSSYDAGASDYEWARNSVHSSAVNVPFGDTADAQIGLVPATSNVTAESVDGEVTIFNPANAAQHTKVIFDFVWVSAGAAIFRTMGSGRRLAAQDTDSIRFFMSSGNIASGSFALYGTR